MIPELSEEEWETIERWNKAYNFLEDMLPEDSIDIIHKKLIDHALEQRERLK